MILAEYGRFLQTLSAASAPEVCKMANLVLNNLPILQQLGTIKGQRVQKIVELAHANWESFSPNIQPIATQSSTSANTIHQLEKLCVGPFRGFVRPETFNLNSSLVFIYGPNGTGKSSFCEALEFALLGNVIEADNKRIGQDIYLKNAHTNSYIAPILTAINNQGQSISVAANEAIYRFCFIEKNRIDNFSRIAAQTPAKQTELISTLFGLDSFNDFVKNFSPEIDGKYIDLIGKKSAELSQKRQSLAGIEQQKESSLEELNRIGNEEATLSSQYREGLSFTQMVADVRGNGKNIGQLKAIENELQEPLATKSQLSFEDLKTLHQSIQSDLENIFIKQQKLLHAGQQVSFKQLYEAVSQVQSSSPENCPACKTSLQEADVNPYTHASEELSKLQHLAHLQQEIQLLNVKISQSLNSLAQIVTTCTVHFSLNDQLSAHVVTGIAPANIDWWNKLHQTLHDGFTPLQHLEAQVKALEENDRTIDQKLQQRATKQQDMARLREIDTKITQLQTRRTTANTAISLADQAIVSFQVENAQLINEAGLETSIVVKNKTIANAYSNFVAQLNAYRTNLPAQLIADLGEKVVELYNAFNRNDFPGQKLAFVKLPLTQNQRLQISFQNNPEKYFDALHILSEGHIRCMGLAILIAKNIKENCPVLIFDDPVNAIDDEHRFAILQTFFVDNFVKEKQIILAIHGEEFFNRTHQLIGKDAANASESYIFGIRDNPCHIQVNSLKRPKNYVLAARELYITGEFRDSLMSARRALEHLSNTAWYHYGKFSDKSDKPISVARRAPDQPWDLRTLVENLISKFKTSKAEIPNKESIIESLSIVLGVDAKQPPWIYLNKGTHDEPELPEFDREIVNTIVAALECLDKALSQTKRANQEGMK